jgi:dihydroorotate dehydrogenase
MTPYSLLRPLLFQLDAELAHDLSLASLRLAERLALLKLYPAAPACQPRRVMGIDFPNPVGLAAGLDKNARVIDGMAALGFGFIEVGTVTPLPQPGNPKPRLFRLPEAQGIVNRFGFNNLGVDQLLRNVEAAKYRGVLGINIGKNFNLSKKSLPARQLRDGQHFIAQHKKFACPARKRGLIFIAAEPQARTS